MTTTMPRLSLLWTDVVIWLSVLALLVGVWQLKRNSRLRSSWARLLHDAPSLCSAVVLGVFMLITVADSVHFRRPLPAATPGAPVVYDARTQSLLDVLLQPLIDSREGSYSAPLAWHSFAKESQLVDGKTVREVARLKHGGALLEDPGTQWADDVRARSVQGLAGGAVAAVLLAMVIMVTVASRSRDGWRRSLADLATGRTPVPWRAALVTILLIALLVGWTAALAPHYHVLGTDRTGNDVLYQALKSVRTAFVIGLLATIATLPLAIVFGVVAGYVGGWVDDVIQYIYTLLSSVPNVLLIAACVLMMQTMLDQNPDWFDTTAERSDIRLFLLCVILGLTGWAGLCRLIRGETLKLRELDYVQAAQAFGVGPVRLMMRHIVPNVMHLVLISTVLDFSALILYEAVLSYVGVGVDPAMNSFGGMINLARSEMSRDPVVWWSFASAFAFMVGLVLAANLFADGVREAFDPRGQLWKPSRRLARVRPAALKSPDAPAEGAR